MKKAAVSIAVVMLVASATVVAHAASPGYYKDEFKTISFSGNDGSLTWSGPWTEWNDGGGAALGDVSVALNSTCPDGLCLQLAAPLGSHAVGAVRWADVARFNMAEVSFQVAGTKLALIDGGATLCLEISFDGEEWIKVHTEPVEDLIGKGSRHRFLSVETGGAEEMAVRFSVEGTLGFQALVDTVKVLEKGESTTTTVAGTTTTTKPTSSTSTTSTTIPAQSTTTTPEPTTTAPRTTSTTAVERVTTTSAPASEPPDGGDVGASAGGGSDGSGGMRFSASGVQAGFAASIFGDSDVFMPVAIEADYRMAVEMVESSAVWLLLLAGVIVAALASIVRRRMKNPADPSAD